MAETSRTVIATGRRHLLLGAVIAPMVAGHAFAQADAWPSRPIRMIIPFPPADPPTSPAAC